MPIHVHKSTNFQDLVFALRRWFLSLRGDPPDNINHSMSLNTDASIPHSISTSTFTTALDSVMLTVKILCVPYFIKKSETEETKYVKLAINKTT